MPAPRLCYLRRTDPSSETVHAAMPTSIPSDAAPANEPDDVPFEEFRSGWSHGRFKITVNPERARKYVRHRLLVMPISSLLLGVGTGLAMFGWWPVGVPLMVAGFVLHRVVKAQAPKILLHLAAQDDKTYREAIAYELMDLRRIR